MTDKKKKVRKPAVLDDIGEPRKPGRPPIYSPEERKRREKDKNNKKARDGLCNLNIRNIDPKLRDSFRKVCADRGQTMRKVLVRHMKEYVKNRNKLALG